MTFIHVVQIVIGLGLGVLNLVYWWFVARRWEGSFRRWCARRYDVEITLGARGMWNVTGRGSAFRRFAIEWLQLAYFMAAFAVWGLAVLLGVVGLSLVN